MEIEPTLNCRRCRKDRRPSPLAEAVDSQGAQDCDDDEGERADQYDDCCREADGLGGDGLVCGVGGGVGGRLAKVAPSVVS